eukprot:gene8618-9548_t
MKIAVVTGDDLMHQLPEIIKGNMGPDVQSEVSPKAKFVNSMNAYLGGSWKLGRSSDRVWSTGDRRNFSGWEMVPDWHNIGFPIVECATDGSFIVTKPPRTGGIVSKGTVAEQLVYEIDDPKNYFLPDVTCDFSQVTLHNVIDDDNNNAVLVKNVMGKVPTSTFKVSGTYLDGFRATAVCPVVGPHAVQKAERVAESILARCKMLFHALGLPDFTNTNVNTLDLSTRMAFTAQTVTRGRL